MPVLSTGKTFSAAEQITSTKLNNIANAADFTDTSGSAVDSSGSTGTCVNGGGLEVTSGGQLQVSDDGVTFTKMQNVAANSVLVRDANSEGDITGKALSSTQILIGDGTGFTAAALSGDATMTNAGVVDISDNVALGGNPTATTQSAGNNTTRIATTAFVTTAASAITNSLTRFTHSDKTQTNGSSNLSSWTRADGTDASASSKTITINTSGYYIGMLRGNVSASQGTVSEALARFDFVNTASTGATDTIQVGDAVILKNGDSIVFDIDNQSGSTFTFSLIEFILIKLT